MFADTRVETLPQPRSTGGALGQKRSSHKSRCLDNVLSENHCSVQTRDFVSIPQGNKLRTESCAHLPSISFKVEAVPAYSATRGSSCVWGLALYPEVFQATASLWLREHGGSQLTVKCCSDRSSQDQLIRLDADVS